MGKFNFNRKLYKDIKKFDRGQMETFLIDLYKQGQDEGFNKSGRAFSEIYMTFEKEISNVKGIGTKTKDKILSCLNRTLEDLAE